MERAPRTHLSIDPRLSGEPIELSEGRAVVELETRPEMTADDQGLVHGGFIFSLADYAAMLAVNEPTVVLASGTLDFRAPLRVGERVAAEARVIDRQGRRYEVEVDVRRAGGPSAAPDGRRIARGRFQCAVPRFHVLTPRDSETETS